MRTASASLTNLLASGNFYLADLYQFTLTDGTVLRYTSFDQDIGGFSSALGWERSQWKISTGLNVDTMDVTLHATPADMVGSIPVIEHIASGAWDGAAVTVSRGYMATPASAPEIVLIFSGWIGEISEIGRIHCHMQLQSKLVLLNVGLPKGLFQPSCRHVFGDAGCTIVAAKISGSVQAGSTQTVIQTGITSQPTVAAPVSPPSLSSHSQSGVFLPAPATYFVVVTYTTSYGETIASAESSLTLNANDLILQVASPASVTGATGWNVYIGASSGDEQLQNFIPLVIGSSFNMPAAGIYLSGTRPPSTQSQGFYSLGTIAFTSGSNTGFSRTIDVSSGAGAMTLQTQMFATVQAGDTFDITVACDHTMSQCANKFNNIAHWGGFPFIPIPEIGSA